MAIEADNRRKIRELPPPGAFFHHAVLWPTLGPPEEGASAECRHDHRNGNCRNAERRFRRLDAAGLSPRDRALRHPYRTAGRDGGRSRELDLRRTGELRPPAGRRTAARRQIGRGPVWTPVTKGLPVGRPLA